MPQVALPFGTPEAAPGLDDWAPAQWSVAEDWQPTVSQFLAGAPGRQLADFVRQRLQAGATIYPRQPFRALALTSLADVRVVIVGQDPYHGPAQAEGLAFSVPAGVRLPPSLRNIFKELAREAQQRPGAEGRAMPVDGSLVRWARQGVLLLNTSLTVEAGLPASHAGRGWETLTEQLLRAVLARKQPVVFLLWGAHAQKFATLVAQAGQPYSADNGEGCHLVLTANHPSPLSALRPPEPFIGCGHFDRANDFLRAKSRLPVDWWGEN